MAQATTTDMVDAIKSILAGKTRSVVTGQAYDNEAGTMSESSETKAIEWSKEVQYLVEAIVEGWYQEATAKGLTLGDSTSTKMDVG